MSEQPKDKQELEIELGKGSLVDLLTNPPAPIWPQGHVIATCVDDRHPVLAGRVLLRCETALGQTCETWAPTLLGLSVRPADRVLVLKLPRECEPVVVGVIDGFDRRPVPQQQIAETLALKPDQVLQINAENGQGLVHIAQHRNGPVVRLLQADAQVELPGKLSLSASSIELQARSGAVVIDASDDVKITGESIHLN
jgi:hypothetical protein